jgi:diguanylate cyclase (GGDEF)-like protein/PAS domain S-box-containing protein
MAGAFKRRSGHADPCGMSYMDPGYLLETFLENTPDHVYFKDMDGRFTLISAALGRWFGLDDVQDALGRTDDDFFAASHAQPARAAELELMRTGEPIVGLEEREVSSDGRVSWVSTTKVPLCTRAGEVIGIFGISRDITQRKLAEQKTLRQAAELERLAARLEELTLHDELTGLYNLRGLELLGGGALDRSKRDGSALCVLFMDLDGLKAINDGFGHAAGDNALVVAAGVLRDALRQTDVVARIGGDEFAAVLVGTSAAEAGVVRERVRRGTQAHSPEAHSLSVSIGLAMVGPSDAGTLNDLIAAADDDMYDGRRRRRRSSPARSAG